MPSIDGGALSLKRACVSRRFDTVKSFQQFGGAAPGPQEFSQRRIAQCKPQAREDSQVHRHGGAYHHEEGVYRLSVDRIKIHGCAQQAERHKRSIDMENDGVADVRNRYSIADPGGPEGLASLEDLEQKPAIMICRQGKARHEAGKDLMFRRAFDVVENAAVTQQGRQWRHFIVRATGIFKESPRDRHAGFDGPFPEFNRIEVRLFANGMDRQPSLRNPATDRGFIHAEVARDLPQIQSHRSPSEIPQRSPPTTQSAGARTSWVSSMRAFVDHSFNAYYIEPVFNVKQG